MHILTSIKDSSELNLKDFSNSVQQKDRAQDQEYLENSQYVKVQVNQNQMIIKKSTLCWFLGNKFKKISSDRIERFKLSLKLPKKNQRVIEKSIKCKCLHVGDWVVFKTKLKGTNPDELHNLKVGKILTFKFMKKKNLKKQKFYSDEVESSSKNIGILCNWLYFTTTGNLSHRVNAQFEDINQYICSIPEPDYKNSILKVSNKCVEDVIDLFLKQKKNKNGESSDSDMASLDTLELDDDSDESESFGSEAGEEEEISEETEKQSIVPDIEKYYAVFYDQTFYIGRALEIVNEEETKFKFLKYDLDQYIWPKVEDRDIVNNKFILHGPLNLQGFGPFTIKRFETDIIKKKFKIFKNCKVGNKEF